MKQSHDSSDDYKVPLTAKETLSEKIAGFLCGYYQFGSEFPQTQMKLRLLVCTLACNINANSCVTLAYRK